jgi:branched-chain amino acid transport system permease protein
MNLGTFYAQHSRLIDQIGINALLALSLSVSLQAGQLALAQAAFAGIAAYVSAIASMQFGLPLPASILIAMLAAALAAAALAFPVRRLRGIFLAIATIGFGEILRVVLNNLDITGGAEGLSGIPSDVTTPIIYGALAFVAIVLVLLARTKFALAVALTREDENAARGVGVDVDSVRFATLVAHAFYFLAPTDFGFPRMEQILVWCVIGGVTSPLGGVLGAVFLSILPEVIRPLADFREITNGLILLGVILFVPNGLSTLWAKRGS